METRTLPDPDQAIFLDASNQFTMYEKLRVEENLFLSSSIEMEASDLDVVLPTQSDEEFWQPFEGRPDSYFLTPRGRFRARQLIDEEKARRFEVKTLWVTKLILPILAALIGIIGAITGLVAVLQHKK